MSEGHSYQVVEPPCLDPLFANPKCFDLAIMMLQWVASEANLRRMVGEGVVEVIKVQYMGVYPSLGVRGFSQDARPALEQLAEELLGTKTLSEFFAYARSSGLHWRQHAITIMEDS